MTTSLKRQFPALSWPSNTNTAPTPRNGMHGLLVRVKRAFLTIKLKREARQQLDSFFRVAGEMGFHPNCQMHPAFQISKLQRVNEIAAQLRELRYGSSQTRITAAEAAELLAKGKQV